MTSIVWQLHLTLKSFLLALVKSAAPQVDYRSQKVRAITRFDNLFSPVQCFIKVYFFKRDEDQKHTIFSILSQMANSFPFQKQRGLNVNDRSIYKISGFAKEQDECLLKIKINSQEISERNLMM